MHIIYNDVAMADALDSMADDDPVQTVLRKRINELVGEGYTVSEIACFVLIEPGDTLAAIEAELNLPIATNAINGSRYGGPEYTPGWEWILNHCGCFEMPFIMTDDGYGHVLLVPDADGIDPVLLDLCRTFAINAEGPHAS